MDYLHMPIMYKLETTDHPYTRYSTQWIGYTGIYERAPETAEQRDEWLRRRTARDGAGHANQTEELRLQRRRDQLVAESAQVRMGRLQ